MDVKHTSMRTLALGLRPPVRFQIDSAIKQKENDGVRLVLSYLVLSGAEDGLRAIMYLAEDGGSFTVSIDWIVDNISDDEYTLKAVVTLRVSSSATQETVEFKLDFDHYITKYYLETIASEHITNPFVGLFPWVGLRDKIKNR